MVKLSRVIFSPCWSPGRPGSPPPNRAARGRGTAQQDAIVPLFVVGFLTAIGLTSTNLRAPEVLVVAKHVQEVLLDAALVGLGTGIHLTALRRTGGRALVLALACWILVSGVAYAGVLLLRR